MAEENKTHAGADLPWGLVFVAIIFLIRAMYYAGLYWRKSSSTHFLLEYQSFYLILALIAFFYFVASVGLFLRKKFGYFLGWFLLLVDVVFSLGYLLYPVYALIGIPLLLLMVYSLLKNWNTLKKSDRTDRRVALGLVLIIILYFAFVVYASNQPTPEEYYKIISNEAREKNDVEICDRLSDSFWKDNCIRDYATYSLDISLCDSINSKNVRDICKSNVKEGLEGSK